MPPRDAYRDGRLRGGYPEALHFEVFRWLSGAAQLAMLVVAAGFWSGGLVWPTDD